MRTAWPTRANLVLVYLLVAMGCKTTQPQRGLAGRTMTVEVVASATAELQDCYEVYYTPDGSGPRALDYPACEVSGPREQGFLVPWRYTLVVSVIPAGGLAEQVVTLDDGTCGSSVAPCPSPARNSANFASLTSYDLSARQSLPAKNPDTVFNPPLVYYFFRGKRVSIGSPEYLYLSNFSTPGQPVTPTAPLGPTNILGLVAPQKFQFEAHSGDTVIVRARKQLTGSAPRFLDGLFEPDLRILVHLTLGGSEVVPTGTTQSTVFDGTGFTCSFVVQ